MLWRTTCGSSLCLWGLPRRKKFHDILQTYEDLADQYGLWDAVSVIQGVWLFG